MIWPGRRRRPRPGTGNEGSRERQQRRLESSVTIPVCPACIAAWQAVEAFGVVSLHDGLEAVHNHIQDIRETIIEQLAATDKTSLN